MKRLKPINLKEIMEIIEFSVCDKNSVIGDLKSARNNFIEYISDYLEVSVVDSPVVKQWDIITTDLTSGRIKMYKIEGTFEIKR